MNPLLKMLASNKARGSFRVEAAANEADDTATVYLYDTIVSTDEEAEWWGGVSPKAFVKALGEITASTIHLRVNSPGGSVFAGRAMEQALREHKAKVVAHVDGLAASAASFVIMGADEVHMAPGSFLMIHKAWTMTWGNSSDLRKEADLLDQIDTSLAKTYATRSGQDLQDIADWMAAETWIEADRAVELGFANSVAGALSIPDKESFAELSVKWDTSVFRNAPKPGQNPPKPVQTPPKAEQTAPNPQHPQPDRDAMHRAVLKVLIPA